LASAHPAVLGQRLCCVAHELMWLLLCSALLCCAVAAATTAQNGAGKTLCESDYSSLLAAHQIPFITRLGDSHRVCRSIQSAYACHVPVD
jgi:hypothetical protein